MRFTDQHEEFRRSVRSFVDAEVKPHARSWDDAGALPRELFKRAGDLGLLGVRLSEEVGGSGLDFWFTAILVEELVRCGSIGVPVSLLAHAEFATKIIDRAGSAELKD